MKHVPNLLLREYVQSQVFTMSLSKSMIAALVYIHKMLEVTEKDPYAYVEKPRGHENQAWNLFVTGARGLEFRGLVVHVARERKRDEQGYVIWEPWSTSWTITRAGELIIELLKESGLWQEYESKLGKVKRVKDMTR